MTWVVLWLALTGAVVVAWIGIRVVGEAVLGLVADVRRRATRGRVWR